MKEFIKNILSSSEDVSSKRFAGLLCIISYILITILGFFVELNEVNVSMANTMFIGGAGLLGANIVEKFVNKKNN